jgi:mitotic spindle assembly checkpoint protein MAD1
MTERVPRVSWAAVCQEKRTLRLIQVFAGKTAEFREVLSAIFGVKVAFYDNGQVRVTLQYDLGTMSVFQPAPWDGNVACNARYLWPHGVQQSA